MKESRGPIQADHDRPENPFFRRLLVGDPAAASRVAKLARLVVGDRGYFIPAKDRPDIVQEVILDVWRAVIRPGFRFGQEFDSFVRTVAYRRCVDWLRRSRPTEELESNPLPGAGRPDEELFDREQIERGRQVLRQLGASCLEVIRLRSIDELSYRQIAERQGRSEGAVRNQMYKCLKQARRILEELGMQTPPTGAKDRS